MYKISICFIINDLGAGGAERQFVELIKNLDRRKFHPTLFLYNSKEEFFNSELNDVTIVQNKLRNKNKILKIAEAVMVIRKYLNSNEFDLIQTTLFMNGIFVRLAAPSFYKNRIVSTIRNSFIIYRWYHRLAERYLIKKSNVVANTQSVAEEFRSILPDKYKSKVTAIYNGFDVKKFSGTDSYKASEALIIGNIGRRSAQKNQIQLLRVMKRLSDQNIKLFIIGGAGDEAEKLNDYIEQEKIDDKVMILDKQKDIHKYYQMFDIFILSSKYEGCPNVLFEAMLSKNVCIISESSNTDQFVTDGYNGFTYDDSDDDLYRKILYVIHNFSKLHYNIKHNAYSYAVALYSIEQMVNSYEQLYLQILKNSSYVITETFLEHADC